MKNLTLIVIVLLFVLSACSNITSTQTTVGESTEAENISTRYKSYKYGTVEGDYIFARDSQGRPVKYNVHDGKMSFVCPDPFCDHESGKCQFYGIRSEMFTSIGNIVYYLKHDETGKSTLYSFDTKTAETKKVFDNADSYMTSVYAYEYGLLIRVAENLSCGIKSYYFWYDTKTGASEKLNDSYVPLDFIIYMIRDDRIIWKLPGKQDYYSTDLHGDDYKEYDFGYRYGNYYKMEYEFAEDGRRLYSLYATFAGESERTCILKDIGPCFYYENKLVYFITEPRDEQRAAHVDENGYVTKDPTGGNVYVANPDGSDAHLLYHTDEFITGNTSDMNHPLVCGDYFGLPTARFEGDEMFEDRLIIANINTGEFVVTHE